MPHTRKHDPEFIKAVGDQAYGHMLIVCVTLISIVAAAGAVGFTRVQHAYEIAARV